jgi:hypothetical protein
VVSGAAIPVCRQLFLLRLLRLVRRLLLFRLFEDLHILGRLLLEILLALVAAQLDLAALEDIGERVLLQLVVRHHANLQRVRLGLGGLGVGGLLVSGGQRGERADDGDGQEEAEQFHGRSLAQPPARVNACAKPADGEAGHQEARRAGLSQQDCTLQPSVVRQGPGYAG